MLFTQSDEEMHSSDEENVSEELQRILQSDGEEYGEEGEGEEGEGEEGEEWIMERPQGRLGQLPHTGNLV